MAETYTGLTLTSQVTDKSNTYSSTTISSGGILNLYASAYDTTVNAGGILRISGGVAWRTDVYGGQESVKAGGTAYDAKVYAGGSQWVDNGVASGTIVHDGGFQHVEKNGQAFDTTVLSGGKVTVEQGGDLQGGTVAGKFNLRGTAEKTTVEKGGLLNLSRGGMGTDLDLYGSMNLSGSAAGTKVFKGGQLQVRENGTATGTIVSSGGRERIFAGGKSIGATIKKKGVQYVSGTAQKTTVAKGGSVILYKGGELTGKTKLKKGATLSVAGIGASAGKIKAAQKANISYDISGIKSGKAVMLKASGQTISAGFGVVTTAGQKTGVYKLSSKISVADGTAFSIRCGSAKDTAALNGASLKMNGVNYSLSSADGVVSLKLTVAKGVDRLGKSSKKETLKGTVNSDIFYGGAGKDIIKGKNGRDVALYDKNAWGKDTINKTSGTMTLLVAGLRKGTDVIENLSGTTMTLTRKGSSDKVTIKGWSADTHSILYINKAKALKKVDSFINSVARDGITDAQREKAENAVFKAAKLATA